MLFCYFSIRQTLKQFLMYRRTPEGAFTMHRDGEVDIRYQLLLNSCFYPRNQLIIPKTGVESLQYLYLSVRQQGCLLCSRCSEIDKYSWWPLWRNCWLVGKVRRCVTFSWVLTIQIAVDIALSMSEWNLVRPVRLGTLFSFLPNFQTYEVFFCTSSYFSSLLFIDHSRS